MENIKELLVNLKDEIMNELPEALVPSMEEAVENVLDGYLEEKVENAVISVIQGLNEEENAKDRLYVKSQDKK